MNMNHKIEEYREILKTNISPGMGQAIREELNKISNLFYCHNHENEEYMEWIAKNLPIFKRVGSQDKNQPFYLQMFTIKSQFVYGDSIYECLDKAMKE